MSPIIQTTIGDFLDYAMGIVVIMIVYYIGKFFLFAEPPTKEERERRRQEAEQQQAHFKDWVGGKLKEHDDKQKSHREAESAAGQKRMREGRVKYPISRLIVALEEVGRLDTYFQSYPSSSDEKKVELIVSSKAEAEKLLGELKNVHRSLYGLRHSEARHFFEYSATYIETNINTVKELHQALSRKTINPQELIVGGDLNGRIGLVIRNLREYGESGTAKFPF